MEDLAENKPLPPEPAREDAEQDRDATEARSDGDREVGESIGSERAEIPEAEREAGAETRDEVAATPEAEEGARAEGAEPELGLEATEPEPAAELATAERAEVAGEPEAAVVAEPAEEAGEPEAAAVAEPVEEAGEPEVVEASATMEAPVEAKAEPEAPAAVEPREEAPAAGQAAEAMEAEPAAEVKPAALRIADLKPGMVLDGTVARVERYGAFVNLGLADRRDGLIHISELAPNRIRRVEDVVRVGDAVRARVVSVDLGRGRIALSLNDVPDEDIPDMASSSHEPTLTSMAAAFQQAFGQSRQSEPKVRRASARDKGERARDEQEAIMRRFRSGGA